MELTLCARGRRFTFTILIIGLVSLVFVTQYYIDLSDTLQRMRRPVKFVNLIPSPSVTAAPITSPGGLKRVTEKKSEKSDNPSIRGPQLLSVESYADYPPYLQPDILKKSSLVTLKEVSGKYNFKRPQLARIIHQSWKTKTLPPRFAQWSKTWKETFAGWTYKLWTDADNELLVKTLFPWFLPRYQRLTQNVQKADAVRYLYLFAQGGIYADLDDECLKSFEHLLKNDSIAFGAMAGRWYPVGHPAHVKEGYVQNSFMYSVPGHPFWLEVIDTIIKRPASSSPESTTGPFMLQEVINKWRRQNPSRQHEMHVYPPEYFNPFSWLTRKYAECKDVNSMTSRDIKKCKSHFKNSYVIQYHTQTWGRGAINTNRNDRKRM